MKKHEDCGRTGRLMIPYKGLYNTEITLLEKKGFVWLVRINESGQNIQVDIDDILVDPVEGKRTYYMPCWNCGCDRYLYFPEKIQADPSHIKVRCEDCSRLFEGERAKEILCETGAYPDL